MSATPDDISWHPSDELLDAWLSNELAEPDRSFVRSHLDDCARCREELDSRTRLRDALRGAVSRQNVPDGLNDLLRAATVAAPGKIFDLRSRSLWKYAVAAMVLIALGWGTFRLTRSDRSQIARVDTPGVSDTIARHNHQQAMNDAALILHAGMLDHDRCAIGYHGNDHFTFEQMAREMGPEFIDLVPLLDSSVAGYKVTVGHRCSFGGRDFVHMILRKGPTVLSVAITPRKGDEGFPKDRLIIALESSGIPLYQQKLERYQVAGFQTDRFLVFVISDLTPEENISITSNIAPHVAKLL